MIDEAQIINAIRQGSTQAYAYLVERYQVGLIIHCEHLVGGRDEAEDIAQWEGKSYQEIAQEMSTSLNTVKSWIHRAKEHLREVLS